MATFLPCGKSWLVGPWALVAPFTDAEAYEAFWELKHNNSVGIDCMSGEMACGLLGVLLSFVVPYLNLLLRRGFSVLQCDLDVVWLRNPQPLFHRPGAAADADMLFQSEGGHGYNGGFYFARRTNETLALLQACLAPLCSHLSVHTLCSHLSVHTSLGSGVAGQPGGERGHPRLRGAALARPVT